MNIEENNIKNYCLKVFNFLKQYKIIHKNERLNDIEKINYKINRFNEDLFREQKNLYNIFHNNSIDNLQDIIRIFYFYEDFEWDFVIFDMKYDNFLDFWGNEFFKQIYFNKNNILEKYNKKNLLLLLFFYFLPTVNKKLFLKNNKYNLLQNKNLDNQFIDLLIFLLKKENMWEEDISVYLLENHLLSCPDLYGFESKIKWSKIIPFSKIQYLYRYGLNIENYYLIDKKIITLFPNIEKEIQKINILNNYHNLSNLTEKRVNYIKKNKI